MATLHQLLQPTSSQQHYRLFALRFDDLLKARHTAWGYNLGPGLNCALGAKARRFLHPTGYRDPREASQALGMWRRRLFFEIKAEDPIGWDFPPGRVWSRSDRTQHKRVLVEFPQQASTSEVITPEPKLLCRALIKHDRPWSLHGLEHTQNLAWSDQFRQQNDGIACSTIYLRKSNIYQNACTANLKENRILVDNVTYTFQKTISILLHYLFNTKWRNSQCHQWSWFFKNFNFETHFYTLHTTAKNLLLNL